MKCIKCKIDYIGLKEEICFNCKEGVFLNDNNKLLKTREDKRKTKQGLLYSIYHGQKASSKKRKHNPPSYSLEEFISWCLSQDIYHRLFKKWEENHHVTDLVPSINRLDDSKGYSFDNIEIVTWGEHRKKSKGSGHKAILKYDLDGNFIKEYRSISAAGREVTGVLPHTSINALSVICRSGGGTYLGFKYKFKEG